VLERLPWLRWMGEFVVIVLGILGAFAVDEYRESRRDLDVADEYLEQLVRDLVKDRHQIAISIERTHGELLAADQVLLLSGASLDNYRTMVPFYELPRIGQFSADDVQIYNLGEFETFEPFTSTYTSIVNNGDLRTIADPGLRRAIVSYYEEIARRRRDRDEFLADALRLKDLLIKNGADVHQRVPVGRILEINGIVPYLSAARDSSHWRLVRLYIMKLNQQTLMTSLLGSGRLSASSAQALRDVLYLSPEDVNRPSELDWDALVDPDG